MHKCPGAKLLCCCTGVTYGAVNAWGAGAQQGEASKSATVAQQAVTIPGCTETLTIRDSALIRKPLPTEPGTIVRKAFPCKD